MKHFGDVGGKHTSSRQSVGVSDTLSIFLIYIQVLSI